MPSSTDPDLYLSWSMRFTRLTAVFYVVCGLAALWLLSPRVPYADQWRHYARLLTQPFARAVLSADNGHPEVLPNLVRWADLHWCGGHETLQIVCAGILAAATLLVLLHGALRDRSLSPQARGAAVFCLAFGVFWLGNLHALTVVGDAVHVYLVLLCLALALHFATLRTRIPLVAICALCALASFSFGSGLASVPAVAIALLMRRSFGALAALIVCGMAIAITYLLLPGAMHDTSAAPDVLHATRTTAQILGAPFVYLLWPLLDPAAASAVPAPLRGIALAAAQFWTAHCGDIRTSVWPQAVFGAGMIVTTALATLRGARRSSSAQLGIALAWFGIACAALIALARTTYFGEHPDQIYALRYLPWTSIGWSGLLLAWIATSQRPRRVAGFALLLSLVALPSQLGMVRLAAHVRDVAETTALEAAVGVLPADQALGETQLEDLQAALPALREARTAMFAWREMQWLDQAPPSDAPLGNAVDARAVVNALPGTEGVRLRTNISATRCGDRLLVADDERVRGLLRNSDGEQWIGTALAWPGVHNWALYIFCD